MRRLCSAAALFLVAVLLMALCASAGERPKEKAYALIFGTVWDPDGHAVYGVTVKIRRASEKKTRWELRSDHHGEFAQRVPAGEADYVISADVKGLPALNGKHLQAGPDIAVHINNDERADTGVHLNW